MRFAPSRWAKSRFCATPTCVGACATTFDRAGRAGLNERSEDTTRMKLYFSPGACSLSPHITLKALGIVCETERVDLQKKLTAGGEDYWKISPKGAVPAL